MPSFNCDQSFGWLRHGDLSLSLPFSAQCVAMWLRLNFAYCRAANKSSSTRDYAKVVQQVQLLLNELDAALAETVLSDQQKGWMCFTVLSAYECCRTCYEHLQDFQALHQVKPPSSLLVLLPGAVKHTKV